jgi:DNA-binding NtrC family response regulator
VQTNVCLEGNSRRWYDVSSFLSALVVEPRLADSLLAASVLTSAGYHVTVADFHEAKAVVTFAPPQILVVDVCQGEFNGLQLVIRAKSESPEIAAVVTCRYEDVVLQREAEALGAAFMVKPVAREELLAAAARTLWRSPQNAEPIRAPFERRRERRRRVTAVIAGPERRQHDRRRNDTAGLSGAT